MIQFEHTGYLYWTGIIPVLILMWLINKRRQVKSSALLGESRLVKNLTISSPVYVQVIKYALFLLSVLALIIAWARPFGMDVDTSNKAPAATDLIFLVDVSKSMYVKDMAPDRLSRARRLMKEMVNQLGSEQVGIVLFAGNAATYVPLTDDHYYINRMVDSISGNLMTRPGTSLREALKISALAYGMNNKRTKVLCLISDGEFHDHNAFTLADSLRKSGVNIFSLGFGTEAGGEVPAGYGVNNDTSEKDENGRVIISHLEPQPLLKITGNRSNNYFALTDTTNTLPLFMSQLRVIESSGYSVSPKQYAGEFLLLAVLLLMAEFCIPQVLKITK